MWLPLRNFPLVDLHETFSWISDFAKPQPTLSHRCGEMGIAARKQALIYGGFPTISPRTRAVSNPSVIASAARPGKSLDGMVESLRRDLIGR
jgi:hypothetical protein